MLILLGSELYSMIIICELNLSLSDAVGEKSPCLPKRSVRRLKPAGRNTEINCLICWGKCWWDTVNKMCVIGSQYLAKLNFVHNCWLAFGQTEVAKWRMHHNNTSVISNYGFHFIFGTFFISVYNKWMKFVWLNEK